MCVCLCLWIFWCWLHYYINLTWLDLTVIILRIDEIVVTDKVWQCLDSKLAVHRFFRPANVLVSWLVIHVLVHLETMYRILADKQITIFTTCYTLPSRNNSVHGSCYESVLVNRPLWIYMTSVQTVACITFENRQSCSTPGGSSGVTERWYFCNFAGHCTTYTDVLRSWIQVTRARRRTAAINWYISYNDVLWWQRKQLCFHNICGTSPLSAKFWSLKP